MKRSVTIDVPTGASLKRARTMPSRSYRAARSSLASKIKRILKKRVETKFITTFDGLHQIPVNGEVYPVAQCIEGLDINQRVGRHIHAEWLAVDWQIDPCNTANPVNPLDPDSGIISIVLDKAPNGGVPIYAQIFDCTAGNAQYGMAFRNDQLNKDRFRILKTIPYYIEPKFSPDGLAVKSGFTNVKGRIWLKIDKDLEYLGNTNQVPNTNALYITVGSTQNSVGGSARFMHNSKLAFTDL